MVAVLLANGADVGLRSRDGSTAAGWAAMFGHREIEGMLGEHAEQVGRWGWSTQGRWAVGVGAWRSGGELGLEHAGQVGLEHAEGRWAVGVGACLGVCRPRPPYPPHSPMQLAAAEELAASALALYHYQSMNDALSPPCPPYPPHSSMQLAAAEELAASALALSHYQSMNDADEVDLDLIEQLLLYICGEGPFATPPGGGGGSVGGGVGGPGGKEALGAVLIFLPGWDEIVRLKDKLEGSRVFGRSDRWVGGGVGAVALRACACSKRRW